MKIYWLLIFVPLAIGAALLGVNPTLVFVLAFFGMIPLAALLSEAVDQLALYTGPSVGALLTATFGTVTEIFILLNLLRQGQLSTMQAEITGSVLLGLLFVIGLSEVLGGIKHGFQEFDTRVTALATSLMALAVVGMLIPTFFAITEQLGSGQPITPGFDDPALDSLSRGVSIALLILYMLYLCFIYRYVPKRAGFRGREAEPAEQPEWSRGRAIGLLSLATLGLAVLSSILTNALEPFGESVGLSTLFLGLIVLPIAGGFADIVVAVRAARNNQIGLSFSLTTSAVLQTALLVAPLMVLIGALLGQPFTLSFGFIQVIAMGLAVFVVSLAANDPIANWFEGAQFITLYIILALWFYLTT
jgi:Ca2+:H+ antiporter